MGLTHAEFLRSLPAALGRQAYTVRHNEVVIPEAHRCLVIHLAPESQQALGLLRLPMTCVTFTFTGYTSTEVEAFMLQFNRHFQRGGG